MDASSSTTTNDTTTVVVMLLQRYVENRSVKMKNNKSLCQIEILS